MNKVIYSIPFQHPQEFIVSFTYGVSTHTGVMDIYNRVITVVIYRKYSEHTPL